MKSIVTLVIVLVPYIICGQCFTDRHNTTSASAWVSCQASPNPNAVRGTGHWIQYDLGYPYAVEQTHFWNYNHPDSLNRGAQDLVIDVSTDGINWVEASSLTLPIATGTSSYEGVAAAHLGGQRARYILITLLNNHGGTCYALGEFRAEVQDEIDCEVSHDLTGDLTSARYEAQDFIHSSNQVSPGHIVVFEAGNEVVLENDFALETGSELRVSLIACTNN